ncbi:hypothetical protein ACFQ0B_28555 [Nonomuraea thailandensis]
MFMLYGPNTNLGHNSIIFMIECQVNHVMSCLPYLAGSGPIEVRAEVMAAWRRRLDAAMAGMVWGRGARAGTRPRPGASPTTGRGPRRCTAGSRPGRRSPPTGRPARPAEANRRSAGPAR